jgi:ubiquinone/menaquinone biosynthesis C-methylase UbiE
MSQSGQQITKSVYEDPEIVEGYIQRNALTPKQNELIKEFSQTIKGKKVLDLGCGPGHDSYIFAELGFEVTGLDYSNEMIRRAKELKDIKNKPTFVVGDMTKLTEYFSQNQFDAIWASASLLHIPPEDLPPTLQGMTDIAQPEAVVYVGLKGGSGTVLVDEDKLGKSMQREFTLWTKESFLEQAKPYGWTLTDFSSREGSIFMGQPTQWLNFFFKISKN